MHLDPLTLMAAGAFLAAASGLVLFAAWTQIRTPALLWWSAASLVNAIGIALLLYGLVTHDRLVAVAAGLNTVAPVLVWCGARVFRGGRPFLAGIAFGPAALVAAGALGQPEVASLISFCIWVGYLAAAAVELARTGSEGLAARWPLIAFLGLHAFIFLGGVYDTLTGTMLDDAMPVLSSWFSFVHFETLIYIVGTMTFMVLICKQRSERQHILAARNDSLTGINNRGAFLEAGERLVARCLEDGAPVSAIMFDLDRFKWINDTFGHTAGDQVIRAFASTAKGLLRPNDVFGRYGGEEFAVLLPNTTADVAYVVAERIRHAFLDLSRRNDARFSATVSGGVASAPPADLLDTLLRAADERLYEAKRHGRNRIERTGPDEQNPALARIA